MLRKLPFKQFVIKPKGINGSIKLRNLAGVGDQAIAQGKYAKNKLSGILKPISMHFNATQALKFPPAESPC